MTDRYALWVSLLQAHQAAAFNLALVGAGLMTILIGLRSYDRIAHITSIGYMVGLGAIVVYSILEVAAAAGGGW